MNSRKLNLGFYTGSQSIRLPEQPNVTGQKFQILEKEKRLNLASIPEHK